ncbi:hypothetical protein PHJA_001444600 [Phtheirospermum japonicum]|uniref:AT-hook motif nuclear-localized protein n=1 Tax=Phtheirospermum japonicum TaxID=374723 RepID=A0A830CAI7_9LAMI|nr:hypothetical protein PHJA_001444600 [Phtheirospermum japonicum]
MDQREAMSLTGSAPYYMHQGPSESVTGLQNSPSNNMSPLSNSTIHYQSNTGGSLNVPPLHLDASSAMSGHGVGVGPPAMQQGEPMRRKRGRPRKYGHDGAVSLGLSPSMSNSAPIMKPTQKWRGRPPGTGRKHQLSSTGGSMYNAAGTMIPHIINVAVGEDIKRKVLSLLQGRRAIVILSGIGSIAAANIKISSSSGSVTYEGHFDMVNLSGSYINDADGPHGPTGGLNVTFSGPDGRLIGGPVEGVLIAASPVQVIAGSIQPSISKPKNNKALEDHDTSGDPDRTLGNSMTPANNIQPSQNLSPMGVWTSSR